MWGGKYRDRITLYANYWFLKGGHNEADYVEQAKVVTGAGFTGIKFDPFAHTNYFYGSDLATNLSLSKKEQQRSYNLCKAVREAVGDGMEIMIETHAMLNFKTAITMAQKLAELDITWYEEPLGPENPDMLKAFRDRLTPEVSICVGERYYTRFGIRPLLEKGICDIIMPDITRCGGPSEMHKMAIMAEAYNVLIAPHNPNGPLSTIASAHICASIPNFFRQEFMYQDVPWRDQVIDHPIKIENGQIVLSGEPGLGVDLLEEEVDKHPGMRESKEGFYV